MASLLTHPLPLLLYLPSFDVDMNSCRDHFVSTRKCQKADRAHQRCCSCGESWGAGSSPMPPTSGVSSNIAIYIMGSLRRTSGRPVATRLAIAIVVNFRCRGSDMLSTCDTTLALAGELYPKEARSVHGSTTGPSEPPTPRLTLGFAWLRQRPLGCRMRCGPRLLVAQKSGRVLSRL